MRRKLLALLASLAMVFLTIVPVAADVPAMQPVTGNPLTSTTAPYLVMNGLTGQSGCTITVNTAGGGTLSVEGLYNGTSTWTQPLQVYSPDGTTVVGTTFTAVGSYVLNCANMSKIRVDGSAATGTPNDTINAGPGIGKVLFNAAGSGAITGVNGTTPINVTTTGGVATVSCPTCATPGPAVTPVSVQGIGNIAVATPSPGVFVVSEIVTPAPAATAVSVQAGPGVAVATPSPGVFVVSNIGVTSVTGSGNMASSGGATPNVTITGAPTFAGQVAAQSYKANNLTSGDCLQSISGVITSASTSCPNGSLGGVTAGTGIVVSTPNPNSPTVSLVSPVAVANGGTGNTAFTVGSCNDVLSTTQLESSNCAQWKIASLTVPAVGGTVTVTSNEGKLFTLNHYSPIFISDGTTAIQGYVNASVSNANSFVLYMTNVDQGTVGATIAANALLSISGLGSTGSAGVTAGSNIVVSTPNPTKPTVAVTNAPTFTGPVTGGQFITAGNIQALSGLSGSTAIGLQFGTINSNYPSGLVGINNHAFNDYSTLGTNSGATVAGVGGTCWAFGSYAPTTLTTIGTMDCSGNFGIAGTYSSATLTAGNCLQAGTNGTITSTSSACGTGTGTVTAVTGSGNISSTGGTTPNVTITAAPTFTNATLTALVASPNPGINCVQVGATGQFQLPGGAAGSGGCPLSGITTAFVVPAVGSTVSVKANNYSAFPGNGYPITISDGTTTMWGVITSGASTATWTVTNTGVALGSVGNTIGTTASVYPGTGNGTTTAGNDIVTGGTLLAPTVAVTNSPTFTGTTQIGTAGSYSGGTGFINLATGFGAGKTNIYTSNSATEAGVVGQCLTIVLNGSSTALTMDCSANLGAMSYAATSLTSGDCLQASTNGLIINAPSGAACPGHQTINIGFGFVSGTVATANVYPYQQVANYTSGKLTALHVACGTADNGTTVFTFTDITSSTTIGTISMTASTTSSTTLGTAFNLTAGHVVHAAVTTAGTATNCGLTAEGTASLLQ